ADALPELRLAVDHDPLDRARVAVEVEHQRAATVEHAVDAADDLLLTVAELDVDLLDEREAGGGVDPQRVEPAHALADGDELATLAEAEAGAELHRLRLLVIPAALLPRVVASRLDDDGRTAVVANVDRGGLGAMVANVDRGGLRLVNP